MPPGSSGGNRRTIRQILSASEPLCVGSRFALCRHFSSRARASDVLAFGLRDVMCRIAQPVAIVTAHLPTVSSSLQNSQISNGASHNHGATLSSLASISLSPPLVSFALRLPSRLAEHLSTSDELSSFKVHLLSDRQERLARIFARQGMEDSDTRTVPKTGHVQFFDPALFVALEQGSVGMLDCRLASRIRLDSFSERDLCSYGDAASELFLAHVDAVRMEGNSLPLLYLDHHYRAVGDVTLDGQELD